MSAMQDVQSGRGEAARQRLDIDGTAGDAQDVAHPAFKPEDAPCCLACGLSVNAGIHRKTRP